MEWDAIGADLSHSCPSEYINRNTALVFNKNKQVQSISRGVLAEDGNGFGDGFLNGQHTGAIDVVKALGGFKTELVYQTR